jgi:hypothetical protein
MIPLRYDLTRWVIATLTLFIAVLFAVLRPTGGALVLFVLLLLTSVGAIAAPPGIYVWLVAPTCPGCGKRVEWAVEQGRTNPYQEQLVVSCQNCDWERTEFSFDPT